MDNPTFDKVRDLSTKFYRELPQALQDELFEALNRGIDILDSEPQMTAYLFAFGKMHQAKLDYAFGKLPDEFFEQPEINIIDYGCGQALGTMCYADFLRENGYMQKAKTIALIEPSEICLKRAALHASVFFPDAEMKTVNKKFDDLTQDDIVCREETPTLHILSNVLDMMSFDIDKFANLVKDCLIGYNQFVCVGPYFKNYKRDIRMKEFASSFCDDIYIETMDKQEFCLDKDWTCSITLFTRNEKHKTIESICDNVFQEADSFYKNINNDLNGGYCKELFCKLQICAKLGDKRCQNQLGAWYFKGVGTGKNYALALEWFFESAMQGYASAYKNIVLIYNLDDWANTRRHFDKVYEYFKNAAQNGDAEDKYFCALCYYYGIGVNINVELAFYWFNESAKQGYDKAFHALGVCYFKGEGIDKNIEKAILSFTKAAQLGNITSIKKIIKLFQNREGIKYFGDEQYDIFVKAAQMGVDSISVITQSWSNKDIDRYEDSYGVQYSNDRRRLLCTNMYFEPNNCKK